MPRSLAAACGQAVGEHDRINSAGARCADAFEAELFLLEQTIKHAPGERATTTAIPQRQVHNFGHLGRSQRPHTCCGAFEDSSIVSAVRLLTATLYPVNIRPLLKLRFAAIRSFSGHVAGVVMILARLLFARLLLIWILIVGH